MGLEATDESRTASVLSRQTDVAEGKTHLVSESKKKGLLISAFH